MWIQEKGVTSVLLDMFASCQLLVVVVGDCATLHSLNCTVQTVDGRNPKKIGTDALMSSM